jgi:inner membrane protein
MALLVYAPVGALTIGLGFERLALLGGVLAVGGAMLPDLDERVSFVAHRGPTHTVWFALAVGAVFGLGGAAIGAREGVGVAVGLGLFGALVGTLTVVAHLLADVLTWSGIRPFAPVSDTWYSLEVTGATDPIANYLLLAAGIVAAIGASGVGVLIRGVGGG